MSEPIYVLTMALFFGTILTIFIMRYLSIIAQAKYRFASDEQYRQLAEQGVAAQAEAAAALKELRTTLASVSSRLAEVEHMLKQVE
jgi:hypothetical protein